MNLVNKGNANIKSLTNKFYQLKEIVLNYVVILIITVSKLFDSFPDAQFLVYGYSKLFRLNGKWKMGGVMIYVREDITKKLEEKHFILDFITGFYLEYITHIHLDKTIICF